MTSELKRVPRGARRALLVFILLVALAAAVAPARAAGIIVNTADDDTTAGNGKCTLREAIINANLDGDPSSGDCAAGSGTDTITFAGDYAITLNGLLVVTNGAGLILDGSGRTVSISGGGATPILNVTPGAGLVVQWLTLRNGTADTQGGAIYNAGSLAIIGSTLSENTADDGDSGTYTATGGALYNDGGIVSIAGSTFRQNASEFRGGGIYNNGGTVNITNSTFSNHFAIFRGGTIYNDGGATTVTNSTIVVGNESFSYLFANVASVYNAAGTTTLTNSVLLRTATTNCFGVTANGTNLADDASCDGATQASTDDIGLGPLADNGGPTLTHALLPGSVAIDHVSSAVCAAAPVNNIDQRLNARNADGAGGPGPNECDAGAYEFYAAKLTLSKATDPAPYRLDFKFGSNGSAVFQFRTPLGVALDKDGNIFVADTDNNRISKFDGAGVWQTSWGFTGGGDGEFVSPYAVAVDAAGRVYVADVGNDRVQVFSNGGAYLSQFGGPGSLGGQLSTATGVAVAPGGFIYVADASNQRIQKFTSGGAFVLAFGRDVVAGGGTGFEKCTVAAQCQQGDIGMGEGEFLNPYGVGVGPDGNVYVADSNNHRVQVFTPDGDFIKMFGWGVAGGAGFEVCPAGGGCTNGVSGLGKGQFNVPWGIAFDPAGNVYVSENNGMRVQKFDATLNFLTQIGRQGEGDGQLDYPGGIAVGPDGRVYVADAYNDRIQVFRSRLTATLDDGQSQTLYLPAGTYTAAELVPPNWAVSGITCNGGAPVYGAASVEVTLLTGSDVTCEFGNLQTLAPLAIYATAAGGSVPGVGAYKKGDVLKWDGVAWTKWFSSAALSLNPLADLTAFDVADDGAGSAWLTWRQTLVVPGAGKPTGNDITWFDGASFSVFFDGSDVGLTTAGERIDGLEVRPGSPGCDYDLLISTVAGGAVRNGLAAPIKFTGEDVLRFCLTASGATTAGSWQLLEELQSEGLARNNSLDIAADDSGDVIYFLPKVKFTLDGATVKPSEIAAFDRASRTFSGPLWKAADHGLTQVVDGIDVVGDLP